MSHKATGREGGQYITPSSTDGWQFLFLLLMNIWHWPMGERLLVLLASFSYVIWHVCQRMQSTHYHIEDNKDYLNMYGNNVLYKHNLPFNIRQI